MQQLAAREIRREKQRTEAAERAAEQAATDERARIAREFHDVVSHHVTAMTLQAEAAVATGDRAVLESLANSGREAAAELRRMLGVLRHPAEESPTQPPDPQPRLADLDGLARRLSGGVEVTVERTGEPRPLPAGVELCAYRVIQEALTNVAKHSDARQASVAIDYAPRRLKIEVVDDGQPVQRVRESGGHGLIGMRERVSLLDGELEVGPRQGHRGYRVFASIPL
jgi:signal transduction histidine kinase